MRRLAAILRDCERRGVRLVAKRGKLEVHGPSTPELREELLRNKPNVMHYLGTGNCHHELVPETCAVCSGYVWGLTEVAHSHAGNAGEKDLPALAAGKLDIGEWPAEPPRPESPRPTEEPPARRDTDYAGRVYSEVFADFARLVRESGLGPAAVDTGALDAALEEMRAFEEREDPARFE